MLLVRTLAGTHASRSFKLSEKHAPRALRRSSSAQLLHSTGTTSTWCSSVFWRRVYTLCIL